MGPGASRFLAPAAAPHTSNGKPVKAAKAATVAKRAAPSAAGDVPGAAPVKKRKKKAAA